MGREQAYSSELSQYLDGAIADAEKQRASATQPTSAQAGGVVGEAVTMTVWDSMRAALSRAVRRSLLRTIVALFPLLALVASTALQAFGQGALWTIPARVVLTGLTLFLLWHAWQVVRYVRGRMPQRLLRRRVQPGRYYEPPTASEMFMPLIVGVLDLPALLSLSFAVSQPHLVLAALIALPVVVLVLVTVVIAAVSGFGAVGAVGGLDQVSHAPARPVSVASLAALDERITRLSQIREWLGDDTLRAMVDDVIGQQVRSAARRQVTFSFLIGVISLVSGWLLSAVSPVATLTNLFPGR